MRTPALLAAALIALAGCMANEVELRLTDAAIEAAAADSREMVDFAAEFSVFGEMDDKQRADMAALQEIVAKYVTIDIFDVEQTDRGLKVVVEGQIPITSDPDTPDPWFILVQPSETFAGTHRVQVHTGSQFDRLSDEVSLVNFMLSPEPFHPTRVRLKADGMDVLAPGAQVDGRYHLVWSGTINGSVRMMFNGGAFDSIGAGFFVR